MKLILDNNLELFTKLNLSDNLKNNLKEINNYLIEKSNELIVLDSSSLKIFIIKNN